MNTFRARVKPYIQPFEHVLAIKELHALTGTCPRPIETYKGYGSMFEVDTVASPVYVADRVSYWETVEHGGIERVTTQSKRESSASTQRRSKLSSGTFAQRTLLQEPVLPNRRCLRYGPHGLHEYRGKFFPQLVRSFINIAGIGSRAIVADPMSGSGTTVVEALLADNVGVGLDLNPLSVFIADTKARLLSTDIAALFASIDQCLANLGRQNPNSKFAYLETLSESDQDYLISWFPEPILVQLDAIAQAINQVENDDARALMRICLSNILRRVSWQKTDDLRVRRDGDKNMEINVTAIYVEALSKGAHTLGSFHRVTGALANGHHELNIGDARNCGAIWGADSIDVVITSPPYATALPYLDTDRLSLSYLGLLPRDKHRARDYSMIGNREVSNKLRRAYWQRFMEDSQNLPAIVSDLITRIDDLNCRDNVGFRRKNLSALLAKYFFDMREVLMGIHYALKPGRYAFVVVGNNRTVAGGEVVEIPTAAFLGQIGESVGLALRESVSMDMLASRDIFRSNSVASEEILVFQKTD